MKSVTPSNLDKFGNGVVTSWRYDGITLPKLEICIISDNHSFWVFLILYRQSV